MGIGLAGLGCRHVADVDDKESAVAQPNQTQRKRDDDQIGEDMPKRMSEQPQQQQGEESRTTRDDSGSKGNQGSRSDKSSDSSSGQRRR
jgi:hypothetical protein